MAHSTTGAGPTAREREPGPSMVSDEKAKTLYGDFKAPKPYIRIIPQPA